MSEEVIHVVDKHRHVVGKGQDKADSGWNTWRVKENNLIKN